MSSTQSTFKRNQNKTNRAVKTFCTLLILGALLLMILLATQSCERELTANASEVTIPEVTKEVEPVAEELTKEEKCRMLGVCDTEQERRMFIENKIIEMASESLVDPYEAVEIAFCESTLNPYAKNPISTAKGVFQFTDPTWKWINADGHQFDYEENIKQFLIYYPVYPSWWSECLAKI